MLVEVARRLRETLRKSDIVVRLGGDEFAFVMHRLNGMAALERMMARVLSAVCAPIDLDGRDFDIQCSIGVSPVSAEGRTAGDLLKNADIALYDAKSRNKGRYSVFQPAMREAIENRNATAGRLRASLAQGGIAIALQPQLELKDLSHIGFEALARWQYEGAAIPPSAFIPVAEETGMIVPLGEAVLEMALAEAARWQKHGPAFGAVAVNVAASPLKQDGFVSRVANMLARHGLAPAQLEIEVTENVLLDRAASKVGEVLDQFHRLGIGIALDDFGTGYASLAHLRRFPVNRLKIDRSFISDVADNPADAAIVRATIGLAHSLGLEVVAEGIETQAQLAFLRAHHCDFGQGYLFSKPIAPAELPAYFTS